MSRNVIAAVAIVACCSICAPAKNASVTTRTTTDRNVTVTALTDNIIRVTNSASAQPILESQASVITTPESDALITSPAPGTSVVMTPTGVIANVNMLTGEVVISAGADKTITDPGIRYSADGEQILKLRTTSRGSYYGAGERGHKLNLSGDTLVMYNRQNYGYGKGDARINQMNITMPLVLSSDGFALVFDDYAAATLALGDDGQITYTTESPAAVSYYFVNGASSLADVTTQLTSLTGRQPLPPLWSLGYITSKYGYHNEGEALGAIDTLKREGYPVDGIVLDLYWYGKEQDMGRLAWDPEQWPDPKGMLAKLKKDNINLVAISQPYVLRNGRGVDNYDYLAANGMLLADSTGTAPREVEIWVGDGGMLDVSNPETRAWLANRYKQLTDMGITGWWGDLGEPEVHPNGLHANGLTTRQYHNQYGNDWSEIIYDMFAQEYPDTRLLTMMRGGTTGLQRYSVFPWSTDVSRSWEGLQPQITIMLNSGLSGLGYMGHDVGGFAVDTDHPTDAELYVRWLQLGLFSPMLRTHAQYAAEPYHYPQYKSIIQQLVRDRYRWLPYNYTLAYENARYGYPLVRPLNFEDRGNTAFDNIDDEYMWGSEVLVAPVMKQGATSRSVTLPAGKWVDYNNPANVYDGVTTIEYPAPLSVLPLFVKAGAIIPMAEYKMSSTADYNPARLTIDYYPVAGVSNTYTMYDDDRVSSSALANGQYRLIHFAASTDMQGYSRIEMSTEGTYPGAPSLINMTYSVKGIDAKPSMVMAGDKKLSYKYNPKTRTLTFDVKLVTGQTMVINIDK